MPPRAVKGGEYASLAPPLKKWCPVWELSADDCGGSEAPLDDAGLEKTLAQTAVQISQVRTDIQVQKATIQRALDEESAMLKVMRAEIAEKERLLQETLMQNQRTVIEPMRVHLLEKQRELDRLLTHCSETRVAYGVIHGSRSTPLKVSVSLKKPLVVRLTPQPTCADSLANVGEEDVVVSKLLLQLRDQ